MNRITHKYTISLQLLDSIEKYVESKPGITIDELKKYFRRQKLFCRFGLSKLD